MYLVTVLVRVQVRSRVHVHHYVRIQLDEQIINQNCASLRDGDYASDCDRDRRRIGIGIGIGIGIESGYSYMYKYVDWIGLDWIGARVRNRQFTVDSKLKKKSKYRNIEIILSKN
jgi:hypothetical protein